MVFVHPNLGSYFHGRRGGQGAAVTDDFETAEMHDPESFLEPKRYRQWFRCPDCGHKYHSAWAKAPTKKELPCPRRACAQERALRQERIENDRLRAMLAEQRTPAVVGANNTVKAVDATAEMVMADYNLTDLRDNIREGESMAPKLPAAAQAAADSYFAPAAAGNQTRAPDLMTGKMRTIPARALNRIAERATRGVYAKRSVSPIEVIPKEVRGQSPLVSVRTERNPHYRG